MLQYGQHCYYKSVEEVSYIEAKEACVKQGAELLYIESTEEYNFIKDQLELTFFNTKLEYMFIVSNIYILL